MGENGCSCSRWKIWRGVFTRAAAPAMTTFNGPAGSEAIICLPTLMALEGVERLAAIEAAVQRLASRGSEFADRLGAITAAEGAGDAGLPKQRTPSRSRSW